MCANAGVRLASCFFVACSIPRRNRFHFSEILHNSHRYLYHSYLDGLNFQIANSKFLVFMTGFFMIVLLTASHARIRRRRFMIETTGRLQETRGVQTGIRWEQSPNYAEEHSKTGKPSLEIQRVYFETSFAVFSCLHGSLRWNISVRLMYTLPPRLCRVENFENLRAIIFRQVTSQFSFFHHA